ncbi:tetraacyldisaccharide 4'-kinase [Methylobacterium gnaphalii]|uniref:Tetraacyldisaccharide 4'-kinase n=1 Tax=Methylobacterium gnaphalii TaxID=1010610 RepID=A0A512JGR2_9HYPH|nr:tetraacyldisaccharide 4'-kinase [Methylobacterium gnaphalii]GEP09123.1 tetraacyldisaccharide 4'-kinase [Methylobacterium gnaphalii]GJD68437.1 Tetraacyldisaccharide 4'-kinase [Methylobacterium gnaphalii]GLS50564.1 tetraacyldisaccharide 4'-kinase [Methylobacterium gnaphalii]
MRAPGFWARTPPSPLARLLAPAGSLYGSFTAKRMDEPGERAACPVLCIGNLTLGGAGKTPTAIAVATMLREQGRRPAFLSRGYGGREQGPLVVDPSRHDADAVGDEPLLLARFATTVVSRDRPAGAQLCTGGGADVVVMDDGLQNPTLAKDLSLAVVDAGAGIGNGLTFPAGPLRVPLARQWPHVGGIVLIGDGAASGAIAREAERRGLPVHRGRLVPRADHGLAGRPVFAFAGIGRPQKFFETLRSVGAILVGTRVFGDHHRFTESELDALAESAERVGATLVTTEKDAVRLPPNFAQTLAVELVFENEVTVRAQLQEMLGPRPA